MLQYFSQALRVLNLFPLWYLIKVKQEKKGWYYTSQGIDQVKFVEENLQ